MEYIILLAFAVASISFTITTTSIFKSLREWVSGIHPKLEELIHCPYCLGHYIAFVVLLANHSVIENLTEFFIYLFALMGMVAIIHYVMLRAYKPVAESMARRKLQKAKKQNTKNESGSL